MSDPHGQQGAETVDGELNVKAIVYSGIGTVVVTIVSMILVWWLFQGFRKLENAQDPKPSALPEAAEKLIPPSPRLELSPPENLKELRDREQAVLDSPAWIDQAQGTVRLPIDLALDVVARRGLGQASPAEPAEPSPANPATAATPEPSAAAPTAATPPDGGAH
ncbi:MAG TPA: hypothetical protein VGS22_18025 [Thermoanaerobaculia bacterium]|jgi:hypothetical protein|nr:hypothetical protein [Thermoanaerobaculia bacterium]